MLKIRHQGILYVVVCFVFAKRTLYIQVKRFFKMKDNSDFDNLNGIDDQMNMNNNPLEGEDDLVMEKILENINSTPIGQVLKKIATLPEVRQKKVLGVRQQLNKGNYQLPARLDIVLDKVLEDITN